jgi:DnaJ-class molecular chaperone
MIRIGETTAECPVCSGRGKSLTVRKWGYDIDEYGNRVSGYQEYVTPSEPCRACAGTGRILQAVETRDEPTA